MCCFHCLIVESFLVSLYSYMSRYICIHIQQCKNVHASCKLSHLHISNLVHVLGQLVLVSMWWCSVEYELYKLIHVFSIEKSVSSIRNMFIRSLLIWQHNIYCPFNRIQAINHSSDLFIYMNMCIHEQHRSLFWVMFNKYC